MNTFSRSWQLTKATFGIMNKDKELYLYPIFSIITTVLFFVALVAFAIFGGLLTLGNETALNSFVYVIIFINYLGIAFIGSFFSMCVVYTAKSRFEGNNATVGSSIGFAMKRIHKIFLWSLLAATVGIILKIIENFAQKVKGMGGIIIQIINNLLGMAWNIVTMFVIQGITYKDLGPFSAVKDSAITLRKTWGESLIKYFGFGIIEFLFFLLGLIIGIPLIIIGFMGGGALGIAMLIIVFLYCIMVGFTFNIANQIYNTALYVYANTGKVPTGYNPEIIKNAFKKKQKA